MTTTREIRLQHTRTQTINHIFVHYYNLYSQKEMIMTTTIIWRLLTTINLYDYQVVTKIVSALRKCSRYTLLPSAPSVAVFCASHCVFLLTYEMYLNYFARKLQNFVVIMMTMMMIIYLYSAPPNPQTVVQFLLYL